MGVSGGRFNAGGNEVKLGLWIVDTTMDQSWFTHR